METTTEAPNPPRLTFRLDDAHALTGRLVSYEMRGESDVFVLHFDDAADATAEPGAETGLRVRMNARFCAHLRPMGYAETPAPGGALRKVRCAIEPVDESDALPHIDDLLRQCAAAPAPAAN